MRNNKLQNLVAKNDTTEEENIAKMTLGPS